MALRPEDVFTPNDFPVHTYVQRADKKLETSLEFALGTPKTVISISGPSKAGKTVLIERVVGSDNLITISGALIGSATDLWDRVLDWMGVPESVSETVTGASGYQLGAEGGGKAGIPFLAEGQAKASIQANRSDAKASSQTAKRGGLAQVEREIAGSEFVVFVDDFHYIPRDCQTEVARQVKAAAGLGIKICLAAVPHRADDAVRSNSELRGRTAGIDVGFWTLEELAEIATRGFAALGYTITDKDAHRFAVEACRSPQLMQQICLQVCRVVGIKEARPAEASLNFSSLSFSEDSIREALEMAASQTDYTSLVKTLHAGPKKRGMERKIFDFIDGSKGDVYRAILITLSADPPVSEINYNELTKRIDKVCIGEEKPGMGSVVQSARHMSTLARISLPEERIIEWEHDANMGLLSISDPYLLFFLRSSTKLAQLGSEL